MNMIYTKPFKKKNRFGLYCLLIIGVTFIAFLPSLNNGFTNWDDEAYVVDNPDIKAFGLHHLKKVFSSIYVSNYQPLTMLTYMAEYRSFQLNPMVYHCTNVLLHIINCLLVFAFIYGLSGNYFTGLLVGLLFAVHPLRVESVAWIAERKDVLSSFFYFLSLLFYVRYMKKGGRKFYGFCLLSFLLSLLSKPMAVSQPFVLLLIDYVNDKKLDKKTLLDKIPFFAIAAVFVAITFLTQKVARVRFRIIPRIQRFSGFACRFTGWFFTWLNRSYPYIFVHIIPFPPRFTVA